MENKGFTLIELLAVIVILAIIGLIATPIVLDIINDVKEEAKLISAENYLEATQQAVVAYQMKNPETKIYGECAVLENGNLRCLNETVEIPVNIDGEKIMPVSITFGSNGIESISGLTINGKNYDYSNGKLEKSTITYETYNNGEEVYIDVTTGKSCTNYHEDNSKTGYNGLTTTKTTANQTSCLKFYAFLDDGSKNLNLLLDHNTTGRLSWTTLEIKTNANGPVDVINQLKTDTNEWVGTITPNNYTYNHAIRPYTVDYSGYKARLITANEVAKITGADKLLNWDEISTTSGWYYLDGAKTNETVPNWQTQVANSTNKSEYYWLFDRTNSCKSYGCQVTDGSTNGYWTSSARAFDSNHAWLVDNDGYVYSLNVRNPSFGVRPVITILKSNI